MSFDSTANNVNRISLAAAYTAASGSMVLATAGTQFGAAPFRITVVVGATYQTAAETLTIFGVSAAQANTPSAGQCTLSLTAIENTTDRNYATTDYAECRLTAGTISDLNSQVNTNTTSISTINSTLTAIEADTITIAAGTGLTGGGSPVLGGSTSLALAVPVSVADGGTGSTTLTAHGVLLGEGTSALGVATIGTGGRIFVDQGASADPGFKAVSGDATLSSAGALTVASIGGKSVTLGGSLTTSGAFTLGITTTANTSVTLPTSGTLVNSSVATLSSLASVGTIATGTWQATPIATSYIAAAAVTYAKIQNMSAVTLLGNPTGSAAAPSEITLGSGLSFSGTTLTATGGGSGTVTSVTFTGDGTVLSSTPSAAVTTSGTLTAALAAAAPYTLLANDTGSSATPTYVSGILGINASLSGVTTLTVNSPSFILVTTAGTITLPVSSTAPGKVFFVQNGTGTAFNLSRQGSDTCVAYSFGSASAIGVSAYSTALITTSGNGQWINFGVINAMNFATTSIAGGICYGANAQSEAGFTAAGTAGQVLQSAAAGTPTWTSSPGSGTALTSVTSAAVNLSTGQATVNGSAGSYIWSQPFQGASYKKVIIYVNGYTNSGTSAITFTTPFTQTPAIAFNGTTLSISTISTTGVTIPISTTQTGFIILEGY